MLVLARHRPERLRTLTAIASAEGLELFNFEDAAPAIEWLGTNEPRIVLFDTRIPRAEQLCVRVRSRPDLRSVPIIALNAEPTDAFTARLYALGADDVVPLGAGASVVARVRALPKTPPPRTIASRGVAVIGDSDRNRCDLIGRVLMNAGYDVKYALDERAVVYYAAEYRARIVVASVDLVRIPNSVDEVRRRNPESAWVITTPRRMLAGTADSVRSLPRVGVTGSHTPAEDLLFLSNELLGGQFPARESTRILFGTIVRFRAPGAEDDEIGFSYNISAGGLYVRTLTPPATERVWLELRPPRTKHWVRLEGRVVWRRPFGHSAAATVPTGFGVQITGALGDDRETWRQAYHAFSQGAPRHVGGGLAELLAETLDEARRRPPMDSEQQISGVTEISGASASPELELEPMATAAEAAGPRGAPPPLPAVDAPPRASTAAAATATAAPSDAGPKTKAADKGVSAAVVMKPGAAKAAKPPPLPSTKATGKRRLIAPIGIAAAMVGAAGAWFGLGALSPQRSGSEAAAPASPSRAGTAVTVAAPRKITNYDAVRASATTTTSATAIPAAAAPSSAASAASAASASLPDEAAPDDERFLDVSKLAATEGYLTVNSSAAADVFVHGQQSGMTNQPIRTRCGWKFVRLAAGSGPNWIARGRMVTIACRASTSINMEPSKL
jgi:DNA-binding response OmpR family regulator